MLLTIFKTLLLIDGILILLIVIYAIISTPFIKMKKNKIRKEAINKFEQLMEKELQEETEKESKKHTKRVKKEDK